MAERESLNLTPESISETPKKCHDSALRHARQVARKGFLDPTDQVGVGVYKEEHQNGRASVGDMAPQQRAPTALLEDLALVPSIYTVITTISNSSSRR